MISFFFFLCASNKLPIYSIQEITEEVKYLDKSSGYYCYVVNSTCEDLSFNFLVFKLMVIDLQIQIVNNQLFCIIIDENVRKPCLRIYRPKTKVMEYPVPPVEEMVSNWGDQNIGSMKVLEQISKFCYSFKEQKSDLRQLFEMTQTQAVQNEIFKREAQLETSKKLIRKQQESIFAVREKQRAILAEYLEQEGTDEMKNRYNTLLGDSEDEDNELYEDGSNSQDDHLEKEDENVDDDNDLMMENEAEKMFEDLVLKDHEKRYKGELKNEIKENEVNYADVY